MSVFLKIMKNGGAYLLLWWFVWRCCLLAVVVVVTIWLQFNRFGLMMSLPYYVYYHDQKIQVNGFHRIALRDHSVIPLLKFKNE